jgi:hypothetical protein
MATELKLVDGEWSDWIEDQDSFHHDDVAMIVEYDEHSNYVRHKVKLPKSVIEVGKEYVDKLGNVRICIYVEDGVAWLKYKYAPTQAYTWKVTGESINLTSDYDIDWSKSV